jgi:hypothetical protein
MNYLDILYEDLLNKIFDILFDLYEKDIENTNNKLLKVKKIVEGLYIDVDTEDKDIYYINYYNISYCIDNYLYSKYPLENVIIIYRLKLIVNYNYEENTHTPIILHCDLLKKPIYFDILREINKIYEKQTKIFGYYDNHRFLENVKHVNKNEYKYYNINPSGANNVNYITFECGS